MITENIEMDEDDKIILLKEKIEDQAALIKRQQSAIEKLKEQRHRWLSKYWRNQKISADNSESSIKTVTLNMDAEIDAILQPSGGG